MFSKNPGRTTRAGGKEIYTRTLAVIIAFLANLLVLSIVHEGAHFLVARKLGLNITELGLGFPWKRFSVRTEIKDIALYISPLLFLAYTVIPPEEFAKIHPAKRILIHLAGSSANFGLGIMLMATMGIMGGRRLGDAIIFAFHNLAFFISGLFSASSPAHTSEGPIGLVHILATDPAVGQIPLPVLFIALGAALNFCIGTLNLFPMPPLDGGRILLDAIKAIWGEGPRMENMERKLTLIGLMLIFILVLIQATNDISIILQH